MIGASNRPPDLSEFANRVFDVLSRHTAFPWPVLKTQCERSGIDPRELMPSQLDTVLEDLVKAVARFTSPEVGEEVRRQLSAEARSTNRVGTSSHIG